MFGSRERGWWVLWTQSLRWRSPYGSGGGDQYGYGPAYSYAGQAPSCIPRATSRVGTKRGKRHLRRLTRRQDRFAIHLAVWPAIAFLTRPTNACGNHVEHRLDVGRRATNDPQYLRGRRLLLQKQRGLWHADFWPESPAAESQARMWGCAGSPTFGMAFPPVRHRRYRCRCSARSQAFRGSG